MKFLAKDASMLRPGLCDVLYFLKALWWYWILRRRSWIKAHWFPEKEKGIWTANAMVTIGYSTVRQRGYVVRSSFNSIFLPAVTKRLSNYRDGRRNGCQFDSFCFECYLKHSHTHHAVLLAFSTSTSSVHWGKKPQRGLAPIRVPNEPFCMVLTFDSRPWWLDSGCVLLLR
jgi:hypothetical protein